MFRYWNIIIYIYYQSIAVVSWHFFFFADDIFQIRAILDQHKQISGVGDEKPYMFGEDAGKQVNILNVFILLCYQDH